jgi:hypothetical protein
MAHFAKLDNNNMVMEVNVINESDVNFLPFPDSEPVGVAFLTEWSGGWSNWKQCSYNGKFRGHHAGIGDKYDPTLGIFVQPTPEQNPSFVLNTVTGLWEPPIPRPSEGFYSWSEDQYNSTGNGWVARDQLQ